MKSNIKAWSALYFIGIDVRLILSRDELAVVVVVDTISLVSRVKQFFSRDDKMIMPISKSKKTSSVFQISRNQWFL